VGATVKRYSALALLLGVLCVGFDMRGFGQIGVLAQTADLLTDGDHVTSLGTGEFVRSIVLPEGRATGGLGLYGPSGLIASQTDVKATWTDGSIKHAIVTAILAETGNYNYRDSSPSVSTITPTMPTAYVELTVFGLGLSPSVHRATMPTSWSSCNGSNWISGPIARECRFSIAFDNSPVGYAQYLWADFDLMCFNANKCHLDVIVNNTQRLTTPAPAQTGPVAYSVDIKVNGNSVSGYPKGSAPVAGCGTMTSAGTSEGVMDVACAHGLTGTEFIRITDPAHASYGRVARVLRSTTTTRAYVWRFGASISPAVTWEKIPYVHVAGTRWIQHIDVGTYDEADYTPDYSSLYAAKAMPNYLSTLVTTTAVMSGSGSQCWTNASSSTGITTGSQYAACWDILGPGDEHPDRGYAGGRDSLGLFPGSTARYFSHPTASTKAAMLKHADLAGSWAVHWIHPATALTTQSMVDIVDVPGMSAGGVTTSNLARGSAFGGYLTVESGAGHQPAWAYPAYLISGHRYYMEEMMFWGDWGMKSFLSGREGAVGNMVGKNGVCYQQVRGIAWGLRDIANAANYLPDGHEHKSYFATRAQTNINELDEFASVSGPRDTILGAMFVGCRQTAGNTTQNILSLWQNGYIAAAVQHVLRQGGVTGGTTFINRLVDYMVALYTNSPDFVPDDAAIYNFRATDIGPTYTPFPNMAALYQYNFGTTPPYGTTRPRASTSLTINSCLSSYSAEIRLAIVVAASRGRPGADTALALLNGQPVLMGRCVADTSANSSGKGSQHGIASMP
jgi:hypothetical protein